MTGRSHSVSHRLLRHYRMVESNEERSIPTTRQKQRDQQRIHHTVHINSIYALSLCVCAQYYYCSVCSKRYKRIDFFLQHQKSHPITSTRNDSPIRTNDDDEEEDVEDQYTDFNQLIQQTTCSSLAPNELKRHLSMTGLQCLLCTEGKVLFDDQIELWWVSNKSQIS